ncbi:amino acid-binding protein [Candidatus Bathyarchaeota archaeon]|nr:MAG: amino acid-binding protein [Candidatus Bathyarchaeota archaeon]RLG94606.1 MAG: amino acid-binding protein [Candidatus Bathyarchaeota archaeon]
MWKRISEFLKDYPERLSVARILVKNGLSIRNGKVYCNEIPVPIAGISRAAGVDRRTVIKTIEMIESNEELRRIFEGIRSAGTSLKEIARHLDLGVVEITPEDARLPGILARSASLLADRNISIRQAIVDDPELSPEPKLTLIAERKIPGDLIPEFLKIRGVSKVSVY